MEQERCDPSGTRNRTDDRSESCEPERDGTENFLLEQKDFLLRALIIEAYP